VAVGRWVPKKGFDLLVRAVERLAGRVQLRLVSDAPPEIVSPHVAVPGLLPPAALRGELAGAGLLALPCRRAQDGDLDGVPVVLMEALAAGLPVLTTSVSGIPELVDEEVGWLVPPDDEDALVAALAEAAGTPLERALRGGRGPGRLRERGFTLASQVDGLAAAWGATGSGAC
jgi:colanic acid/amylovoran biosynthesis glycosyltransferase